MTSPGTYAFHGAVRYLSVAIGPPVAGIDIGQIREFGVDAVAARFAQDNAASIFLTKHSDWTAEAEYRFVLMDHSLIPAYVDIRKALTGVLLGDAFPQVRIPALLAMLEGFPGVEILQVRFHNRRLSQFPCSAAASLAGQSQTIRPWAASARDGSFEERLAALREAELSARDMQERGAQLCEGLVQAIDREVDIIGVSASQWPHAEAESLSRIEAVPTTQRSRKPGVQGELIHYERGRMCVVENLPKYTCTLMAAAAIQLLGRDLVRIHAMVTMEEWRPNGNQRSELWRISSEVPLAEAAAILESTLLQLRDQTLGAKGAFEAIRSQMRVG